ncbi:hypothetical protein [Bartonella rattaustraliani]|nr:hypothetical protein [Bartonella rattaustraliani]
MSALYEILCQTTTMAQLVLRLLIFMGVRTNPVIFVKIRLKGMGYMDDFH